jgi:hypothetical protein
MHIYETAPFIRVRYGSTTDCIRLLPPGWYGRRANYCAMILMLTQRRPAGLGTAYTWPALLRELAPFQRALRQCVGNPEAIDIRCQE